MFEVITFSAHRRYSGSSLCWKMHLFSATYIKFAFCCIDLLVSNIVCQSNSEVIEVLCWCRMRLSGDVTVKRNLCCSESKRFWYCHVSESLFWKQSNRWAKRKFHKSILALTSDNISISKSYAHDTFQTFNLLQTQLRYSIPFAFNFNSTCPKISLLRYAFSHDDYLTATTYFCLKS